MVYSHWLPPRPEQVPGHGQMGCMVLCRTFHTTANRDRDLNRDVEEWVTNPFSGPETVSGGVF